MVAASGSGTKIEALWRRTNSSIAADLLPLHILARSRSTSGARLTVH
jgi:hypothetical protein